MQFGKRLKTSRKNKNLTQEDVAKEFCVSRQTISSWENENSYPDIDSLVKLSNLYDVSLDIILKEDKGMKEYMKKKEAFNSTNLISILLSVINLIMFIYISTDFKTNPDYVVFSFFMIIDITTIIIFLQITKIQKRLDINKKDRELILRGKNKFYTWLKYNFVILIMIATIPYSLITEINQLNPIKILLYFLSFVCFSSVMIYLTIRIKKS